MHKIEIKGERKKDVMHRNLQIKICDAKILVQHQEPAHVYFVHEVRTRVKSGGDRN